MPVTFTSSNVAELDGPAGERAKLFLVGWQRWNQWRPPPKTESGRQKRRSNDGRGVEMQRQDAAHATEEWTHPSFVNEKNLYYGTLRKFDFELILTFPLKFLAHAQWDAVLHGRLELALNQ